MRGLSGPKRSRAGKNGVCGWWQRALGGKEGKVCGEGTSERFCVSLTGFSATPGKFLPVLPRKNLSNTWGKGAPFPSFLGCCLSERLRHFVFRKTGLKITAWSDKIFAVFWGTGASVGQTGKSWESLEPALSWRSTFRRMHQQLGLPANSFRAWAPPKPGE